jgi:hypothetical protein
MLFKFYCFPTYVQKSFLLAKENYTVPNIQQACLMCTFAHCTFACSRSYTAATSTALLTIFGTVALCFNYVSCSKVMYLLEKVKVLDELETRMRMLQSSVTAVKTR